MPMLIGAAIGGGVSALRGGDPLKGALMGAAGGGLGAATGLLGGAAGGAAGGTGGGFAGGGFGSLGLAGQTALQGAASAATPAASGFLGNTLAGMGSDIGAASTFMNQNPVLTQMGMGLAQQALTPEQLQYAPAGQLSRGQMSPMQMANMPTQPFMPQRISLI